MRLRFTNILPDAPWYCNLVFPPILIVYEEENLVTALVPSERACLANSPGSIRRQPNLDPLATSL